ncbi:hypothetical protein [Mesorhizobium sp. L-8-3]|uniref:hypothetical protein n=1 Tax=Mesorhizobium sp. L-8-3 TaxID=2744522 RepID=UPI001928592D|nr:hypothetical protein [Mesorhizobium sp. L-8-3]BCG97459.1 hypothetical protein MesoLj131a_63230 [Mesorhizobium sp. 131-2-1]BCH04527.1 hypothetical protein MesoLj131b_65260 [Mesorhizobium sp. 131-2-5]BCH27054.1 hypothetical protein MesoLjLb_68390 [Mesorhizobium sp. L-8-3]
MAETPTMAGITILDAAAENRIITDPGTNALLTGTDVETLLLPCAPPAHAQWQAYTIRYRRFADSLWDTYALLVPDVDATPASIRLSPSTTCRSPGAPS